MGGRRGRLIRTEDRSQAVTLITEAHTGGSNLSRACTEIGITIRTFERWRSGDITDQRKGAAKVVANKLSQEECQAVLDAACAPEHQALTPMEIVPKMAEQGIYLASERTFYRLLKARNLLHHRANSAAPRRHTPPTELAASAPGQIWSWDITYLRTYISGIYFYTYLILDVFSRKIVGWEISDRESDEVSSAMMERIGREQNLRGVTLHSDRGQPMKGANMVMKLYELGVMTSYSRPRVSDDNPYSEALFRTIKYNRKYPGRFETLTEAREWFAGFINWYNTEHLHSGIGYVTPSARHNGTADIIFKKRNETYRLARTAHPQRWARGVRKWQAPAVVYLNPSAETKAKICEGAAA